MKKRIILVLGSLLIVFVLFFANILITNFEIKSNNSKLSFILAENTAKAGGCRCKDDPGDICSCYGHDFQDCDEAYWWQQDDCNEDEPEEPQ